MRPSLACDTYAALAVHGRKSYRPFFASVTSGTQEEKFSSPNALLRLPSNDLRAVIGCGAYGRRAVPYGA